MISIANIDRQTAILIVKDLLNKEKGYNLIPYAGGSNYKPDLWQGDVNSTYPRIVCEIINAEIRDFDLFNSILIDSGAVSRELSAEMFVLVVLKKLSNKNKLRFEQDFQQFKIKEIRVYDLTDIEELLAIYPEIEEKYRTELHTWYEAYAYVADLLNDFYIQHKEESARRLYSKLEKTQYAFINNTRLFNPELNLTEKGLDPIQIFATFNFSRIQAKKRLQNIELLLEALGSLKRIKTNINFDGIPSLIITQVIQFRGWGVQNEIWKDFSKIVKEGIHGLTDKNFDHLKRWRGIEIPSYTMFLFWINSEEFLPLDVNTVNFLKTTEIISSRPKNFKEYYFLCTEKAKIKGTRFADDNNVFRLVVKDAYGYYEEKNSTNFLSGSTETLITSVTGKSNVNKKLEDELKEKRREQYKNFKIIGIRPKTKEGRNSENDKQRHLKNLDENHLYQFYHAYEFAKNNDDIIKYHENLDHNIYNQDELNISISAVVGMNGSGKSTITDLMYLVINRIAFEKKIKTTYKLKQEEIYADLFIKSDKLYKISVGSQIEVFEYTFNEKENQYIRITSDQQGKNEFRKFDIENLCYTLVLNYSFYSLNSKIVGDWINPLFHKNDSYQVPIVFNPKRDKGIIDVNIEDELAKSRLLSNLLEPKLINFKKKNVPALVPGSVPDKLLLELDIDKLNRKRENHKGAIDKKKIAIVMQALGLKNSSKIEYFEEAQEYIYLKLISIAYNYSKFKNYKKLTEWIGDKNKLDEYLLKLSIETSHITFKLRQAINYIKYGLYKTTNENRVIDLSSQIFNLQQSNTAKQELRTVDLVPPPFIKANIKFIHNGTFDELSSGEKQQIFSINTIAYHLFNIKSVMVYENVYKYNSVNIIFDEVELYFHPDMQRTFIDNLRYRIISLNLNENKDINNVNIIFITHSPFILSDIPNSNILKLKKGKSVPFDEDEQTFGANVHDLLANDFFMENGFMGEFAKSKILSLSNHLNDCIENDKNIDSGKKWKEQDIQRLISIVGEPLIKDGLNDLLSSVNKNTL